MSKVKIKQGLRDPVTGRYWNLQYDVRMAKSTRFKRWTPTFHRPTSDGSPPTQALGTPSRLARAAIFYETTRLVKEDSCFFPELELVTVQTAAVVELSRAPLAVPEFLIRAEKFRSVFGDQFANSYLKLKDKGQPVDEFPLAFRRTQRAGEREEILSHGVPCLIEGAIVWVKNEAALVHFRLASQAMTRIYYVDELRKTKSI